MTVQIIINKLTEMNKTVKPPGVTEAKRQTMLLVTVLVAVAVAAAVESPVEEGEEGEESYPDLLYPSEPSEDETPPRGVTQNATQGGPQGKEGASTRWGGRKDVPRRSGQASKKDRAPPLKEHRK